MASSVPLLLPIVNKDAVVNVVSFLSSSSLAVLSTVNHNASTFLKQDSVWRELILLRFRCSEGDFSAWRCKSRMVSTNNSCECVSSVSGCVSDCIGCGRAINV